MPNSQPDTLPQDDAQPHARGQLPLLLELEAVQRILSAFHLGNHACLDIGFLSPAFSRQLQACGGFWTSVTTHPGQSKDCVQLGAQVLLPFEDKQFDVVVLASGCLSGEAGADTALVHECHRVLKISGYLILTVAYDKPIGLANLLNRRQLAPGSGGFYSEAAIFDLLKTGFDWLGLRTYCRFWMQLVRQWAASHQPEATATPLLTVLYWIARGCDSLIFFHRGYLMTAYGRRKGWRSRPTPRLTDGRNISDAVLHPR